MFDVICIGNALIDSFLTIHEANEYCRINSETGELSIKTGQKIPLEKAQFVLGGNSCNVSVGLSRLGLHTALLAEFGKDEFAHRMKKQLEIEKVSLTHSISTDTLSSMSIGINFKNDRSLFVWHVERQHKFEIKRIQTNWVFLSSMGESWRHVYREVPSYIRETQYRLAFNPGTRQIAAGEEVFAPVLAVTDVLFVNKEEAESLLRGTKSTHTSFIGHQSVSKHGKNSKSDYVVLKELLVALQKLGPKEVVITDGGKGAYSVDSEGNFYHQSCVESNPVEKTGAGDSFTAAFLAAKLYGRDTPSALHWGAVNAASVISKIGAQPGLLTKEQLEKRIKLM